jgi:hypothetical protein
MRIAPLLSACLLAASCSCTTIREAPTPPPIDGKATVTKTDDMLVYAVGTRIEAPKEAVWRVLVDGANYTKWNSTLASFQGDIAQGKQVELVTKAVPDTTFQLTVSELVPNEKMVWEDGMPMGLFAGVRTYRLRAEPDGATVFTMSEVFSGGMLGMIEGSLPDMRSSFETVAADLKRKVEADVPSVAKPEAPTEPPAQAPAAP